MKTQKQQIYDSTLAEMRKNSFYLEQIEIYQLKRVKLAFQEKIPNITDQEELKIAKKTVSNAENILARIKVNQQRDKKVEKSIEKQSCQKDKVKKQEDPKIIKSIGFIFERYEKKQVEEALEKMKQDPSYLQNITNIKFYFFQKSWEREIKYFSQHYDQTYDKTQLQTMKEVMMRRYAKIIHEKQEQLEEHKKKKAAQSSKFISKLMGLFKGNSDRQKGKDKNFSRTIKQQEEQEQLLLSSLSKQKKD